MKIAIPVRDDKLNFFPNAGHTPKFAIYEFTGSGMFKSFKLDSIINSPRTDIDHSNPEAEHDCNHGHDDADHIEQHNKMGYSLKECKYIVVKKACKNTANSFIQSGLKLVKYNGEQSDAAKILSEVSSKFI